MNVLVLNLTRLGDLLQSQPAVSALAANGHRIGLVCLENFAEAAGLMRDVARVYPLRGARLLARLDSDWRQALAVHREFVDTVRRDFSPDLVINLTPSQPARLLARGFGAPRMAGFALDEFGFNADTSLWAAFLQMAATTRGASPFNIVDMFRRIAGPEAAGGQVPLGLRGPQAGEREQARARLLAGLPCAPERGFVAVQLGASEDRRRWPVECFAHVVQELARQGFTPVLLGTASERPLAERFTAMCAAPAADLVGATGLRELAAVLAECSLLITNDTGTMHLAAGLGVPCLALFLCTAQPWDTGPYLPGCLCLESDLDCHPCSFGRECPSGHACRRAMDRTAVLALAEAMLGLRALEGLRTPGARVWRTVMGPDGLLDLESLSGHEADDRTRLIRVQRALLRPYLDAESLPEARRAAGLSPEAARELSAGLNEALSLLALLERQGELLLRDPIASMKAKFLGTWQRVRASLENRERLALLAALWTFEAERPGLDLPGILALAARFADLLRRFRDSVCGTSIA